MHFIYKTVLAFNKVEPILKQQKWKALFSHKVSSYNVA